MRRSLSVFMLTVLLWNLVGSFVPSFVRAYYAQLDDCGSSITECRSSSESTLHAKSKPCDSSRCDDERCQFHFCHFGHCGYDVSPVVVPGIQIQVAFRVLPIESFPSSIVLPGVIKPPSV